jgi:hypothetical protein
MRTHISLAVGLLLLSGCSGSMSPKVCVDTTAIPALPGVAAPADASESTDRCGGFVLGLTVGERSSTARK